MRRNKHVADDGRIEHGTQEGESSDVHTKAHFAFTAKATWKNLRMQLQRRNNGRRLRDKADARFPSRITRSLEWGGEIQEMLAGSHAAREEEDARFGACDARHACLRDQMVGVGPRACGRAAGSMRDPSDSVMLASTAEAIRVDLLRPGMTVVKRMEMHPLDRAKLRWGSRCVATMGMEEERTSARGASMCHRTTACQSI